MPTDTPQGAKDRKIKDTLLIRNQQSSWGKDKYNRLPANYKWDGMQHKELTLAWPVRLGG